MPFSPDRGSQDTLVTLTGQSLFTTSGIYLISGSTRGQCTIISTGNSFTTFYPPSTPPGNLRSGNFQLFNLYGNATTSQYFTWIETPYISGIAPLSGFTGTNFKISGSGIRDATGLYLISNIGTYTGVLNNAIFEANTWIRTGIIPWMSGGLNSFVNVKVMSEGGSSTASQLFFVREDGLSLSGLVGFPSPIQTYNYLRGNSTADALEWQTPNQILNNLTGVLKSGGDDLTGNYRLSGNLTLSGVITRQVQLINDPSAASGANILNNFSGQLYWSGQKVLVHSGVTAHGVITYNPDYPNANVETGVLISGQRIELGQIRMANTTNPFDISNVLSASGGFLLWTGVRIPTMDFNGALVRRADVSITAATGSGIGIQVPNNWQYGTGLSKLRVSVNGQLTTANHPITDWTYGDYSEFSTTGLYFVFALPTGSRISFEIMV